VKNIRTAGSAEKTGRLGKSGTGYIKKMLGMSFAPPIIFLAFAGRIDLDLELLFFGFFALTSIAHILVFAFANPSLLNVRGEKKKDTDKIDKVLILFLMAFMNILPVIAAGIEVGRLDKGFFCLPLYLVGIAMMILAASLEIWAMGVNVHFERYLRIQTDRDHRVIQSGPYRIIRHPGYLAYFLRILAFPLSTGSYFSIIPVALALALIILRTYREDRLLLTSLAGYDRYCASTKYRLIPFVW
jgi:protein-S-isoprenylcysteine O-methyltransferase Ste14